MGHGFFFWIGCGWEGGEWLGKMDTAWGRLGELGGEIHTRALLSISVPAFFILSPSALMSFSSADKKNDACLW